MKLVIIEGVGKKDTIKKYLGSDYEVVATKGHVRDLPQKTMGVNTKNNFEMQYTIMPDKQDIVKMLKEKSAKADKIYLATDPDREGEAISWHLCNILGLNPSDPIRIEFNEITKNAINKGLEHPRAINLNLVNAQQTRRVIDRLVGYRVSPKACKAIQPNLSAGRVQSVALRLVVDRENEIRNFVPQEYWSVVANLKKDSSDVFKASLVKFKNKKIVPAKKEEVDEILEKLKTGEYKVKSVKKSLSKVHPSAPFTTSTMQQEASRKLGFTLKRTMSIAQGLYEGVNVGSKGTVGLITYMRTDSTRISNEARAYAKEYIVKKYGENYYENRYYKTKQNSQDAHEAIRPTYIDLEPETIKQYLSPEQYKLYKLIYNRFIASQMASAIYDTMSVNIDVNTYNFRATGQNLKFKGFMTLYVEVLENEKEEIELSLPELQVDQEVIKQNINSKQSFTTPPPRYTEASLVKALEEKGIGRPSTYSPTITTILERRYIEKEQKQLVPTELGKVVNKLLVENFSDIIDVEFTAKIEEEFDAVAEGKEYWKEILREFYPPFKQQVDKAEKELEHVKIEEEVSDIPCEKCGRMMVVKYGRYGKFLACPGYPECKNTKPIVENIDVPCPVCGSKIQVRKTKKKRKYYICENNPKSCNYISWNKPKQGEKWEPEKEQVKTKTKKAKSKRKTKTTKK